MVDEGKKPEGLARRRQQRSEYRDWTSLRAGRNFQTVVDPAGHDEFEERARLVAEAQTIAQDYSGRLLRAAMDAFLMLGVCLFLIWLGWRITAKSAPEFLDRDPVLQEIGEHVGR